MKTKPDNKDRFVIIMAGGRGERFWPVSRAKTPKQLIKLLGDRSFLQQAVGHVLPLVPPKNILVITTEAQAPEVRKQLPRLPKENVVAEPIGRDTCAAVTLGEALPPPAGVKAYKTVFHRAEQFVEKPNYDTALGYLQSGQYRWNAGMFIWSFVTLTEGLQKHQPEMYAACQRWFKVANNSAKLGKLLAKEYPEIKRISVDYALMEHAHNVVVADGAFEWDDFGSWTALARHLKADPEGNCAVADFIHVDGARNIIFDARTKDRRTPIAVVGLRDSILVQTDDATLLAHKSQAQKVKELVKKLSDDPKLKKLV